MAVISVFTDIEGQKLSLETGRIANLASGSVIVQHGDIVVLAAVTMSEQAREDMDYFPLVVDYQERFYAAGKIKGSRFVKREGRPSETAILTSRLIDRPMRPLFKKGMQNEVQIICTMLSTDQDHDPGTIAMIGASAAIMISGIPFDGPVAAVRIGLSQDGKFIINPTYKEIEEGRLDLVLAGTKDAITMVECGANEVDEETVLKALDVGHEVIKKLCELQEQFLKKVKVEPKAPTVKEENSEMREKIATFLTSDMMKPLFGKDKVGFKKEHAELDEKVLEHLAEKMEGRGVTDGTGWKEKDVKEIVYDIIKKYMREKVLKDGVRLDGRKLEDIRKLNCTVGIMPRTHGSALFERGFTQALTLTTLGGPGDAQVIDEMDKDCEKRYIHHYNFPPYSVGEVRMLRGPGRREIGHGNLAERALLPVLPDEKDFPYTMHVVSEIMTCDGSSSMASVCGSTLSLMDAGVPLKAPVAGIAMGLIMDEETGKFQVLTDIQGQEDFLGDMDFKVAGTKTGITALQLDIKVKGLRLDIFKTAFEQAKRARMKVLDAMLATLPEPRKELSPYAPLISSIQIKKEQIRDVIGRGGETIQKICRECNVEMDIDDETGTVVITAPDQESGKKATDWVKRITYLPQPGEVFEGKVTRIMDFGAFVEFLPDKEGLVHISQLAPFRVERVEDVMKMGDRVKVKLTEIDEQGRYNLSHKEFFKGERPPMTQRPPMGPRPGGFSGGRPSFRKPGR